MQDLRGVGKGAEEVCVCVCVFFFGVSNGNGYIVIYLDHKAHSNFSGEAKMGREP